MGSEVPVISVSHVGKAFGEKQVLEDISLQVERAETFGILSIGLRKNNISEAAYRYR